MVIFNQLRILKAQLDHSQPMMYPQQHGSYAEQTHIPQRTEEIETADTIMYK